MKMTKFYDLKKSIEKLGRDYKIAKKNGNTKEMDKIQAKYEGERKKLCHYREQIAKLDVVKMSAAIDSGKLTPAEKKKFQVLLGERTIYEQNRKNKQFVNIVEGNDNMDSFNHRNGQKALNLVRRQFDKIVIGAALVGFGAWALVGCSNNNEDTKEKTSVSTEVNKENTENNTQTPTTEGNTEVTTNDENNNENDNKDENNKTDDSKFTKLNDLPEIEEEKENGKEDPNMNKDGSKGNNQNVDSNTNGKKLTVQVKIPEKKVVEERLDPHVNNDDAGKTTTVTVEKEETKKEMAPVDYSQNKDNKNTNTNKEEKVTIIEKEEDKKIKTDDLKVDGEPEAIDYVPEGKKEETKIPTEEKVIIIEKEEETKINTNVPVDGETVIYEEVEETHKTNTDNLPIDESNIEGSNKTMKLVPTGVRGGRIC